MKRLLAVTAIALGSIVPGQAFAADTIVGIDALHEWNLIVLGDLTSSSEVEGRTFVGGDLKGNSSNYQTRTPPPSSRATPGLTVVGNVTGGTKNLNGGGATVGGNVTSGFNLNGGPQTVNAGGAVANTNVNQNIVNSGLASTPGFLDSLRAQRDALVQSLTELSTSLSSLASNAVANITGSRATFDAQPDANGLTVYSLTANDLSTFGEIDFSRNGADTVIVNVSGSSIGLHDNFLGNSDNLGANVIWNFAEASDLQLSTAWRGSILAPNANGTIGNYIQGSAVFGNLTQNGELHLGTYTGNYTPPTSPPPVAAVPEPSSWAMMLLGFGALGSVIRRRRAAPRRRFAIA